MFKNKFSAKKANQKPRSFDPMRRLMKVFRMNKNIFNFVNYKISIEILSFLRTQSAVHKIQGPKKITTYKCKIFIFQQ